MAIHRRGYVRYHSCCSQRQEKRAAIAVAVLLNALRYRGVGWVERTSSGGGEAHYATQVRPNIRLALLAGPLTVREENRRWHGATSSARRFRRQARNAWCHQRFRNAAGRRGARSRSKRRSGGQVLGYASAALRPS